jgi:hypothetical protein
VIFARKYEIGPESALRVIRDYPDRFSETEVTDKGRMAPAIELASELSEDQKIFVISVRNAGEKGIASSTLWRHKKVKSQDSAKFASLVATVKKGVKIYYLWRPEEKAGQSEPAEMPPEPTELTVDASEPENKEENSGPGVRGSQKAFNRGIE